MRKIGFLFLSLCFLSSGAHAQGAAPEMFGVREVVIEPVQIDDPKAAAICGVTRDKIAQDIAFALKNTTVPAIPAADAKPASLGVARILLSPEVYTYATDSLDCVSWVSLVAQSHSNAIVPPISTLRAMLLVYWQQHTRVISGESLHGQRVSDVLEKMASEFADQYKLDNPPDQQQ